MADILTAANKKVDLPPVLAVFLVFISLIRPFNVLKRLINKVFSALRQKNVLLDSGLTSVSLFL